MTHQIILIIDTAIPRINRGVLWISIFKKLLGSNVIDGNGAEKSIRLKMELNNVCRSHDIKIIMIPGKIAKKTVKLNKIDAFNERKIKSKDENNNPQLASCFLLNNNKIFNKPNDKPIKNNSDEK